MKKIKQDQDPIKLLNLVHNVNFKFEEQTYLPENIFNFLRRLIAYDKNPDDDLIKHRDKIIKGLKLLKSLKTLVVMPLYNKENQKRRIVKN